VCDNSRWDTFFNAIVGRMSSPHEYFPIPKIIQKKYTLHTHPERQRPGIVTLFDDQRMSSYFLCAGIFNFRFLAFVEDNLVLNKSRMQMNSPGIKIKSINGQINRLPLNVAYSSFDKFQPPNSISHVQILRSPSRFVSTQLQSDTTLIPAERVPETADWALAMAEDKSGVVLKIN
jgi:hypothetical protein